MRSPSDETHGDRGFRAEGDADTEGLRARLERYGSPARQPTADEPLTPELALVDPDLARRARESLPEPRPKAAEPPRPTVREAERRRPRRRRRLVAWMLAVTLLGAAAGLAVSRTTSVQQFVSKRAPTSIGPIGDQSAGPPPSPSSQRKTRTSAGPGAPPGVTQSTRTATSKSRRAAPKPTPPRPAAPSSRAFAWVPVPGASSYLVQFYRGRKEIFRARPSAPRFVLPGHWSFEGREYSLVPGRYRWSVRPRLRGRRPYGPPIVRAKLVIQDASGDQSTRRR